MEEGREAILCLFLLPKNKKGVMPLIAVPDRMTSRQPDGEPKNGGKL